MSWIYRAWLILSTGGICGAFGFALGLHWGVKLLVGDTKKGELIRRQLIDQSSAKIAAGFLARDRGGVEVSH